MTYTYHMPTRDPEKLRAKKKRYAEKHRDVIRAAAARHREKYREKRNAKERERVAAMPKEVKYAAWRAKLLRRYGMTKDQYDALHDAQNGVCAICRKRQPSGQRLVVDHCHRSGVTRGLLCHKCNMALGLLFDDIELLRAAIEYLGRWP